MCHNGIAAEQNSQSPNLAILVILKLLVFEKLELLDWQNCNFFL